MRTALLFATTLAFASQSANAAEQLADRERIATLIRQLDDDDFRTRDRAARELRQIGHATLDLLNTAAAKGSPEVRERAERLARTIRSESFAPGKPAEGMQATLRADREVFRANQPIAMHLEIKNVGYTNLGIPSTIRWSYSQTYGPEWYRVRGLYVPSHANIEVHQLSGRKPAKNQSPIACGHPGNLPLTVVKPGNAIDFTVPVTMMDRITPGEYEVCVTFHTDHVVKAPDPKLDPYRIQVKPALVTNKVRFVVE